MKNHLAFFLVLLLPLTHWAQTFKSSPGKLFRINNVEFSSRDGFPLKATMYQSTEKSPGILLFHVMGVGQRFDYENLAIQLAMQGFNVLSVDLRGHGESKSDQSYEYTNKTLAQDEDAALQFLKKQPNVLSDRIGLIGASGTVAEAIGLASRHSEVLAIAGFSGHSDRAGMDFLAKATHLPILGIGAKSDSIMTKMSGDWQLQTSAETMKMVVGQSTNPHSQVVIYEDAPHGTAMLNTQAGLIPMLANWLVKVLMI